VDTAHDVEETEKQADETFTKISHLSAQDIHNGDGDVELKEHLANYAEQQEALAQKKADLKAKLAAAKIREDCDMQCVKMCSHWNNGQWSACFTTCGCTSHGEEGHSHTEITHTTQQCSTDGTHYLGKRELFWEYRYLDHYHRCRMERHYHNGYRNVVTCPSSHECHFGHHHGEEVLHLRREIRAAASIVYSYTHHESSESIALESETLASGKHTIVTLTQGDSHQTYRVTHSENYPHAYIINYKDSEGESHDYMVMLLTNKDGSFSAVIMPYDTAVFLQAFAVTLTDDGASLGGSVFTVKEIKLIFKLRVYFQISREKHLRKWGIYKQWKRTVSKEHFHDVGTDTTHTLWSFIHSHYHHHHTYNHIVKIYQRTYNQTVEIHHAPETSITIIENNTVEGNVTEPEYNEAYYGDLHFRIYPNGNVTYDNGTVLCHGGIEGLKKEWELWSKDITTEPVHIEYNGKTYSIYEN